VCCRAVQCVAGALQCVAVCRSVLQYDDTPFNGAIAFETSSTLYPPRYILVEFICSVYMCVI